MDVSVDLDGQPELAARLAHAHAGVLQLGRDLEAKLLDATPPTVVFASPRMRARQWADVWELPAGGWLAARDGHVRLPDDPTDILTTHVQDLLDGH